MSQDIPSLDDPNLRKNPGGIGRIERWWIERQEALEQAGYMLRPRFRPGWQPSWTGTKKPYYDFEDGHRIRVSVPFSDYSYLCSGYQVPLGMDATRISDGRPVMLKKLPTEEGPYELEINKLFSTEPLVSDPRNHCVRLLDVIELPNDPPIIVHPLLRPFADPPLRTFGEFVTFFSHTCEVSLVSPRAKSCSCPTDYHRVSNSCMRTTSPTGM